MADPTEIIRKAPPEVEKIIRRVLKLERDWMHMHRPKIKEDIVLIIKEEVK